MFLSTHGILRSGGAEAIPYSNQYSFELDGSLDYFTFNLNTGLNFSGDFTLSAWIKTDSVTSNQYIIDTSTDSASGSGYSFRVRTDGKIRFWSYHASQTGLNSATVLSANTWHHIACVHTSTQNKIYIDGVLDATKNLTTGHSVSVINNLRIGNSKILGGYFNGNLDEVAMYDVDMSSSISSIYNSGTPIDLNTLADTPVSYYRMGEFATYSSEWVLIDKGQQSNNLTSVSMSASSRTTDTP